MLSEHILSLFVTCKYTPFFTIAIKIEFNMKLSVHIIYRMTWKHKVVIIE